MQYDRRSVEFRLLREHVIARQAYRNGMDRWFGGRMLDVFLLLAVSAGMQDGPRDSHLKNMRECLDTVSALADPFGKRDTGKGRTVTRRASDEDRIKYLDLMAAGMHNAGKHGFTSLKELRQAMDALKETVNHISSTTAGDSQ